MEALIYLDVCCLNRPFDDQTQERIFLEAEAGNADIFLTTDDRILRLAARSKNLLQVRVENPLQWVMEVTNDRRD